MFRDRPRPAWDYSSLCWSFGVACDNEDAVACGANSGRVGVGWASRRVKWGSRQLLEELLRERFGLDSGSLPGIDQLNDDALIAAIGTFPSYGHANVHLSSGQSRLLDAAGFVDTPGD